MDSLRLKCLAERFEVLHFKSDMIDNATCGRDVGDRLIAFPSKEIQAVSDAWEVRTDEEIRLPRSQRGVERLHVPLLHFDILLVDEMNVVTGDRRRTGLRRSDQFDLHTIGAEKI